MKKPAAFSVIAFGLVVGALAFRLPGLPTRPMHVDEAVQAIKAGELLETNTYRYDPHEYHGPTLPYITLPFLWLTAGTDFAATSEFSFRLVPALFGVGLVLLTLLLADGLGRAAVLYAGALCAISPAMVFYSRYYIHETLLVFFIFGAICAGWRYTQSRNPRWALLAGAFLGLMHATKETCIIAYAAMLLALALTVAWRRQVDGERVELRPFLNPKVLGSAAAVGGVISFLLFTSFLTNLGGAVDSISTYFTWFGLGTAGGLHDHPWTYYLSLLTYTKYGPGPTWSEGFILALAVVGVAAGFTRWGIAEAHVSLVRFFAFYTVVMMIVFSAIPYKTPWNMLSFLHGAIVLAGVGAAAIVKSLPSVSAKACVAAVLLLGGLHLTWQAYQANFTYLRSHRRNPYVYAHTSPDALLLAERVEAIAQLAPEGHDLLVHVITPDFWPLPWYLRRLRSVGYWEKLPDEPAYLDAPVIITSPALKPALDLRLRDSYQMSYFGLRPTVNLNLYIRRDLWDRFLRLREHNAGEHDG